MNRPIINLADPVNREHPLNRGLVGWWMALPGITGGSRLVNLTGRNHGTLTNMIPSTAWKGSDRAGGWGELDFADLSDDRVDLPGGWSGTEGTIAAWVKRRTATVAGKDYPIWTHFLSSTDRILLEVETQSLGGAEAQFTALFGASDNSRTAFGATITVGKAHHVGATWKVGQPLRIYVDGALSGSSPSNFVAQTTVATEQLGNYAPGNNLGFGGRIDDARRYSRAISAAEMLALFSESRLYYPVALRRISRPTWKYLIPRSAVTDTRRGLLLDHQPRGLLL